MHKLIVSSSVATRSAPNRIFKLAMGLLMFASLWMVLQSVAHAGQCASILQQSFKRLQDGQPVDLCQYAGKVVLVVNTASYCGNTDQYNGLEDLYRRYKNQGLVVLGFPANDFGNQEPDSNAKIAKFCRSTYGVEFPMFEKSSVVGAKRNPLFAELSRRTGQQPEWNFHKYLIDRKGERILSFEANLQPNDARLREELGRMLGSSPNASSAPKFLRRT